MIYSAAAITPEEWSQPIDLTDIWIRQVRPRVNSPKPRCFKHASVSWNEFATWNPPDYGNFVYVMGKDGKVGFWGPINDTTALIILKALRPNFLSTSDLRIDNILSWTKAALRHGLTGEGVVAASAVELAVWDLIGKRFEIPVYKLLFEKAYPQQCYASLLGIDPRDPRIIHACKSATDNGFFGVKISLRSFEGPSRTIDAFQAIEHIRRSCGDMTLMADCHGQWSLSETIAFCNKAVALRLYWLEEPIHPRSFIEYGLLASASEIPIAAGEHAYTRDENALLTEKGVTVLQPDVAWCGGLNEFRHILKDCESMNSQIAPHGTGFVPAVHVLSDQYGTNRLLEFHCSMEPLRQFWFSDPLFPIEGLFAPSDDPGFGNELRLAELDWQDYRNATFQ